MAEGIGQCQSSDQMRRLNVKRGGKKGFRLSKAKISSKLLDVRFDRHTSRCDQIKFGLFKMEQTH